MLASTVQFSNNTHPPPTHPNPHRPPTLTEPARPRFLPGCAMMDYRETTHSVFSQDPIVHRHPHHLTMMRNHHTHPTTGPARHTACWRSQMNTPTPHTNGVSLSCCVLLRKEVIQPHLPVRLPCYDFVPIADPTFDGSLHKG